MRIAILIAIILLNLSGLQAQEGRRERIKSLKIAYITEKLELTPQEAQKFWPVYNAHEEELYTLKAVELGNLRKKLYREGMESLTEAEAATMLDRIRELENKIFESEKKFQKELRNTLSAKKVIYLGILEENFKRELLRKLQQKRRDNNR